MGATIVIATGIYPPDIGGPAYYAQGLERALRSLGYGVAVVPYGRLRKFPTGISHALYLCKLLPRLFGARAVIALDTASVGFPAALACMLLRKRLVIRTGGDFVWESYLERTGTTVPLPHFYTSHPALTGTERLVYRLTRFALRHATTAFSTEMQRSVWMKPYALILDRTEIIGNAAEPPLPAEAPAAKNFLWHVRPIVMKNGERVQAAFAAARRRAGDIVLEEGTLPHDELLARMRSCYAVILPSVTEISPNYILEALRFKKPFIMDKYSGLAEWLAPYGTVVDPLNEREITEAIVTIASEAGYRAACEKAARFSYVRTYEDIARDFLQLLGETA